MNSLQKLRHSTAHVLASAIIRIFPDVQLDIGPPTESGFYYDFDLDYKIINNDLKKIELEMKKIIQENQDFKFIKTNRKYAKEFFKKKNQFYKLKRLDDIEENEVITFYTNGDFTDLCAGDHISNTSQIKAFKLLSISGIYYKGNSKNKQMQRIYGTAFYSENDLNQYLKDLQESKKVDHRKIGKELGLFHIDEQVGPGLILWTPKGSIIRKCLEEFISKELAKQEYEQVYTPHIGKLELFKNSGHFPYYSESQYSPLLDRDYLESFVQKQCSCSDLSNQMSQGLIDGYLLKPMNCPMHIKIFASQMRSYKELPIRLAEFGTVYRFEKSGELNGMTRVRGFTQDDAHIFCTECQVFQEINSCLILVKKFFSILGINKYRVRLGTRSPNQEKYIGSNEIWQKSESNIRLALNNLNISFSEEKGEAAFYGPKIDFIVKDFINREWQLGTIQIDYNLPNRFNLTYQSSDNKKLQPVMIHRAPFGSFERFTGLLIEHFKGNFPTWLSPEQVKILPINNNLTLYAKEILKLLKLKNIRSSINFDSNSLNSKICRAEKMKIPYLFIIGNKEKENQQITIRSRNKNNEGTFTINDSINRVLEEIKNFNLPLGYEN